MRKYNLQTRFNAVINAIGNLSDSKEKELRDFMWANVSLYSTMTAAVVAEDIRRIFNITDNFPNRTKYWIQRGHDENHAALEASRVKLSRGERSKAARAARRNRSWVYFYRVLLSFTCRLHGEKREQVKDAIKASIPSMQHATKDKIRSMISELIFVRSGKQVSRFLTDYWIDLGFTEDEAKDIVVQNSTYASSQNTMSSFYAKRNFKNCYDYWLSRGYSLAAAKVIISSIQTAKNSTDAYISRYGQEKGIQLRQERTDKWLATLRSKEDYANMNARKGKRRHELAEKFGEARTTQILFDRLANFGNVSREATGFFDLLVSKIDSDKRKLFYGDNEYMIDTNNRIYKIDFVDLDRMIAIEYNGVTFHSREPGMKTVFGEDTYQADIERQNVLATHGFKSCVIWSDDPNKLERALELYETN